MVSDIDMLLLEWMEYIRSISVNWEHLVLFVFRSDLVGILEAGEGLHVMSMCCRET